MTVPITVNVVRTSNLTEYHISTTPLILCTTLYMAGILTRVTRHFILKANIWEILITKLILRMLHACAVSSYDYTATAMDEWFFLAFFFQLDHSVMYIYVALILVTKANAVDGGATSATWLKHKCNQSTNVTDGVTVTSPCASLQHKTRTARNWICQIVLNRRMLRTTLNHIEPKIIM